MRDFGTLKQSEYGCARCGSVFAGIGLFDAHQTVDYNTRPAVSCVQNGELSRTLVRDGMGTWITPSGLLKRAASAARLTANRQSRQ